MEDIKWYLEIFRADGTWAVLFASLLIYTLYEKRQDKKEALKREKTLMNFQRELAEKIGVINTVSGTVSRIENNIADLTKVLLVRNKNGGA